MYAEGSPAEIQIPTHWNLIDLSITARRLYYRPSAFFRHLHLTALSFPQGKIRLSFQKYNFLFFYLF
jgi:hypothetical protein